MAVPTVLLNSGRKIPMVGLGTWKSKPGEVQSAVIEAISCGYRHIDCADAYGNQDEVGNGIQAKIDDGTVKREDLFVTDKLWNTYHAVEDVKPALVQTLKRLKLDYVDLYLMHWPMGYLNNGDKFPKDENGKFLLNEACDYVDTWKVMEELQKEGLVRDIGVSNFNEYQLTRIMKECSVKPAMNQVELHPYLVQEALVKFCKDNDIAVTAYSPLGSPDRPWAKESEPVVLENPKIIEIAKRIGKTPGQVLLRFPIERGLVVIPKSVTPSRIKSNFELFDFKLSKADIDTLLGLNINFRGCGLEWISHHKYFPFKENYSE